MIYCGDSLTVLKTLPSESVDCCVTSPPYWGLRDYGVEGQLGLEKTPEEYVKKMGDVFSEVKRVLKEEGTLWLNLGDSYANSKNGNTETIKNKRVVTNTFKKEKPDNLKQKDLCGIPWRVAFALQADGWYLRQDIIWHKPNPMPESVTDRCTKAHEYIFLLAKSQKYYFDNELIKEKQTSVYKSSDFIPKSDKDKNGDKSCATMASKNNRSDDVINGFRNKRSVWTITTKPFKGAHFATFPEDLITPCILAGCPEDGTVLDPFFGSGTTGLVAKKLRRDYIGIELNPKYVEMAEKRIGSFLW